MTLAQLKEEPWYQERPAVIQQAIDKLPPFYEYRFKDSKKECWIYSYDEPESSLLEDVTVTVQKTGYGGILGFNPLDTNKVFGVQLNDLEIVP